MTAKKSFMPKDKDNQPIPIMSLSNSQDVDGTSASAQSSAIDGDVVRVCAIDAEVRVNVGDNPTATTTSIYLPQYAEIYLPIKNGQKVAILGGKANVCTAGLLY
jgi:hypothetical protein